MAGSVYLTYAQKKGSNLKIAEYRGNKWRGFSGGPPVKTYKAPSLTTWNSPGIKYRWDDNALVMVTTQSGACGSVQTWILNENFYNSKGKRSRKWVNTSDNPAKTCGRPSAAQGEDFIFVGYLDKKLVRIKRP